MTEDELDRIYEDAFQADAERTRSTLRSMHDAGLRAVYEEGVRRGRPF